MSGNDKREELLEEFLTVSDVAKRLRLNPETVRIWLRTGQLAGTLLGDRAGWRIDPEDLRYFLEQRRSGHGAVSAKTLDRRTRRGDGSGTGASSAGATTGSDEAR